MKKFAIIIAAVTVYPGTGLRADVGTLEVGGMVATLYNKLPSVGPEVDINLNKFVSFNAAYLLSHLDLDAAIKDMVKDEDPNLDIDIESAKLDRSLIVLGTRIYPFAGSLNIGLTGATGQQRVDLQVKSNESTDVIDEEISYTLSTANITIGHAWRWKNAFFGFDWLGYSTYLSGNQEHSSNTHTGTDGAFANVVEEFKDFSDALAEEPGVIFLTARFGFGF